MTSPPHPPPPHTHTLSLSLSLSHTHTHWINASLNLKSSSIIIIRFKNVIEITCDYAMKKMKEQKRGARWTYCDLHIYVTGSDDSGTDTAKEVVERHDEWTRGVSLNRLYCFKWPTVLKCIITKTRLFRYVENFTAKNWKILDKNSYIFHISAQNIDCGYPLEPPQGGGSNEYPQSIFFSRNKKNNVYPCKPTFYYIKVGFKGVKIILVCFRNGSKNERKK